MLNEIGDFIIKLEETRSDFIFETIYPYCEERTRMKISKNLLIRALREYKKNHPKEFEGSYD